MKTKIINLYSFNELSNLAKEKAIEKWYEHEDFPFLSDDLMELLKDTLKTKKIEYQNLKHYYSLSYCQGDGYCFIGKFYWKNLIIEIEHRSHYYHSNSVDFNFYSKKDYSDKEGTKNAENFKKLYLSICKEQEKYGYEIIEYRMNEDEFSELCDANDYSFLSDGTMENY